MASVLESADLVTSTPHLIENKTFDEIALGETASIKRRLTQADIELFAILSGDVNPAHLDERFAARTLFRHVVAHGMWSGALFSAILGTKLPGPGSIYLSQDLHFLHPVHLDDTITASVTVSEKRLNNTVVFDCSAVDEKGVEVVHGTAEVKAPSKKVCLSSQELPDIQFHYHDRFRELTEHCRHLLPLPTVVVHPCDAPSLIGAHRAAEEGLIIPILVGPEAKIQMTASESGIDLSPYRIVGAPHSHAAAEKAMELVRTGEVRAVMKGSLHTDELMKQVLLPERGLRTGRRMSHVFIMDVPAYPKLLMITDAAINVTPKLLEKKDICQNAIDLALAIGITEPKVAILSAVETVTEKLPSTLDAAALCKMAERRQITGGFLDGPLAFDNAVSPEAAHIKGIHSKVAGQADILLVNDLEEGNVLAKQMTFLAGADAAGIVMGARVPIILTSRSDGLRTRLASCAVALLIANARLH
jgi:phosphate acetyltransferase